MHMWAALPWAEARFGSPAKWLLVFLAGVVWPVSLALLMIYMHGQRRKQFVLLAFSSPTCVLTDLHSLRGKRKSN